MTHCIDCGTMTRNFTEMVRNSARVLVSCGCKRPQYRREDFEAIQSLSSKKGRKKKTKAVMGAGEEVEGKWTF